MLSYIYARSSERMIEYYHYCPTLFGCNEANVLNINSIQAETAIKMEKLISVLIVAHVLKAIYFYYGSQWNVQLRLFTKCFYDTAACMCLAYCFSQMISWRDPVHDYSIKLSPPDTLVTVYL